jgi:hypothetical protein
MFSYALQLTSPWRFEAFPYSKSLLRNERAFYLN